MHIRMSTVVVQAWELISWVRLSPKNPSTHNFFMTVTGEVAFHAITETLRDGASSSNNISWDCWIAPHVDHVYTRVLPVADLWGKIELDVRVLIRSDRCVPSLVAKFENYSILQPSGKAPRNRLLLRQVSAKQGGPVLGPQHHKTSNLSKPEGKCR